MDPMQLINPASELTARKVIAVDFIARHDYIDFLEKNPYIEVISVVSHGGAIVLTYKEAF
jgi:hypothetical protein